MTATPNTAPVPTFLGFTVDASLTMNASGQLTATDGNNDPLTYAITAQPSAGTITTNASGAYTYTGRVLPGTYSFTYTVTDGKSTPVARTATITVNDVAPVAPNISPVVVNDRGGGLPITPFSVA